MPQCKEDHKLGFTIKLPVSYSPLAHENTETLLKYSWCNISVFQPGCEAIASYAWFHSLLKSNVQVYLMRHSLLSPF